MALKLAVWAPVAREPIMNALKTVDGVEIREGRNEAEYLEALDGADAAILAGLPAFYTPAVGKALQASDTVKWVHLISAGHEGAAAAGWAEGIVFTHAGGAVSGAVSEHAIALLLALMRGLPRAVTAQAEQKWVRDQAPRATTLSGGVIAVVGLGTIGRRIARIAKGFGATVLGVSRSGRPVEEAEETFAVADLHAVLPRADFVVAALPLTGETQQLFDAAAFAAFKPGAYFVNVGRGGSVDEAALAAALEAGALAGAGLDVTAVEPLPSDSGLWRVPNLLITGHYAGAGDRNSGRKIADGLLRNIDLFRRGAPLDNQVIVD